MKLRDFFKKLETDGKITNAKFQSLKETAPENFEMDDEAVQAFESSFLTPERAATDKSIHSRLKREILDPVDTEIKPLVQFIDTIDRFKSSEIDKLTSTYDKVKAIQAAIPELYEKLKKTGVTDEDTKKKLKTLEESNRELLGRIETMNGELASKEKFYQGEASKKINDYRLNSELEKLANSFKFGKAYSEPKIREEITKVRLDRLRSKHPLELVDKDGRTLIQPLNKEGKPLFKDNSNTAVSILNLLEEEFADIIKASDGKDDDDDGKGSKGQDTKRFRVPDDKTKVRQGARTTVS